MKCQLIILRQMAITAQMPGVFNRGELNSSKARRKLEPGLLVGLGDQAPWVQLWEIRV